MLVEMMAVAVVDDGDDGDDSYASDAGFGAGVDGGDDWWW